MDDQLLDEMQNNNDELMQQVQSLIDRGQKIMELSDQEDDGICDHLFGDTYEASSDSFIVSGRILKSSEKAWYFLLTDSRLKGVAVNATWLPKSATEIEEAGDIVKLRIVRWVFESRYEKTLNEFEGANYLQACEACGEVATDKNPMEIIDSGQHICHNCRKDMQKS